MLTCKTTWSPCKNIAPVHEICGEDYNRIKKEIADLQADNGFLINKIDELQADNDLLRSNCDKLVKENENLINDLTAKAQSETKQEIDILNDRLNTLELALKQSPTPGIFSYIEKIENQTLFIKVVEEAIAQNLTYAQIDDYMSTNLPVELGKIIKDHPSLTRNYIRNLRRE